MTADPAETMSELSSKALALAIRITMHDADGQLVAADFRTPADCTTRLAADFEAFAEAVAAAVLARAGRPSAGNAAAPEQHVPELVIVARLACPHCGTPHLDQGEWAVRPHRKHRCARCGKLWAVTVYGGDPPALALPPAEAPALRAQHQEAMDEIWNLRVKASAREQELERVRAEVAALSTELAAVPFAPPPEVVAWMKAPPEQREAVRDLLSMAIAKREQAARDARVAGADGAALGRSATAYRAALAALEGLAG